MFGCKRFGLIALVLPALFTAVAVPCVTGQGLQNVIRAQARVFPTVGPGVTAVKRDSSGRYFILAEPASTISIFNADGKRLDQIPNANSHGATIRYAVAIDVDSRGRLFVADRGDNTIKIFAPDGSLAATIPVTAPTSVVALPDDQFAVTTLQSQRLVQIMNEKGATVRTFGDPADEPGAQSSTQPVMDRGRIVGDSAGNIYFAFTSLPDPTLQRFDSFGYSAFDSVLSAEEFGALGGRTGREVDLGYQMSGLTGPTSVGAWTDLHSLKGTVGNRRNRAGAAGVAGADSSASTPTSSGSAAASTATNGGVLSYSSDSDSGALDVDSSLSGATGADSIGSIFDTGVVMPGMLGMGIGDPFRSGGMMRGFHPEGGGRPEFAGHFPEGGESFEHGRPGFGMYRASATVRVALDDPSKRTAEKPVITAVGVDPATQEVWTAVSDTLVHLDKNGNRLDTYYPVISDGTSLKITSILVEPNRILVASDPWGIYEFPRPDKAPPSPPSQNNIVPQQLSPAPPSVPAR
jgi:hypothetical protein